MFITCNCLRLILYFIQYHVVFDRILIYYNEYNQKVFKFYESLYTLMAHSVYLSMKISKLKFNWI